MDLGEKDIDALFQAASRSSEPDMLQLACGLLACELGGTATITGVPDAVTGEELKQGEK